MKSSINSARQLFGLTLTLVGLLSWHILPIAHPELAVRAANRVRGAEPTGQTVSRAVANGRIAFVSGEGNAFTDIYTMNPDGSNVQRLTNSNQAHYYFDPAWSPDGTKIAFARFSGTYNDSLRLYTYAVHEIFVMNADGSDQRRLTQSQSDSSPTWSPDGTKIAFWRVDSIFTPRSREIFVMNADGSDQRPVASTSDLTQPAWSPDGLKFAVGGTADTYNIYLINLDGSNRTQITQPSTSPVIFEDHDPAWSPDGSKITFIRCVDSNGFGCWDTTSQLWVVNADGSNPTKLTDTQAWSHAWSPDGTKIIVGNGPSSGGDLLVMNPDGSGLTNITNTDGKHEHSPSWQALPLTLPNPIDDPEFFVRQQYRDFLNREPDTPGLTFWTNEITECSNPEKRQPGESFIACTERKRANTSAAFFLSPEFQNTGSFVLRVYWGTLGKLPNSQCPGVPSGLAGQCRPLYTEYVAEVSQVATGIVVNDQLDPNVINANKRAFIEQFVTKPAFRTIYESLNSQQFVDKLFATTGINASAADRATLVNGLNGINGQPATETRSSVVFKVVDGTTTQAGGALVFNTSYGQAFYDKEFDDAFVFMEYIGYLRRNPDQVGYEHWLSKLKLYGNWMDAQMVLAFISSPEYRARFGQP